MSRKFRKAIDRGDIDLVRQMLVDTPSLATELISWGPVLCPCKTEPLHYMSDGPFNQLWDHGRQAELAEILVAAGAPVDGLPGSGETPLHGAASLGEAGVARVLLDHGADIESIASYPGIPHGTPLDFAVHFGMVEVVDLLVSRGANILSARMAAGAGELERLKKELPDLQQDRVTLLDTFRCAAVCDRRDVIDYLLADGIDVNTDIDGATVLHWAAWEAKPAMVKFLTRHGADPNREDSKYKLTPLGWAKHRRSEVGSRWGHDEVCQLLNAE